MALTKTTNRMTVGEVVNVLDYIPAAQHAAIADGSTTYDASSDIQAAIDTGKSVYLPVGTYYIETQLSLSLRGQNFIGESRYDTIIKVKEGITGIRITAGGQVLLENFTMNCDRAKTGTWASTASKGIYAKVGPDDVAQNPTSYFSQVDIRRVEVNLFYESIEMTGFYYCKLEDVDTRWDFTGLLFNRSRTSVGFTGTTLMLDHVFCHGHGNAFSEVSGSTGALIQDVTNITVVGSVFERYEQCLYINGVQCGNLDDLYIEDAKHGIRFHTVNGRMNLRNVYYNDVGDQHTSGGTTLRVAYSKIFYTPGRFIFTDNSAQLDTSGEILNYGQKLSLTTGTNSTAFRHYDLDEAKIDTVTASEKLQAGGLRWIHTSGEGTGGVDKSLTINIATLGNTDWRAIALRIKALKSKADSNTVATYHEKLLTFSHLETSNSISDITDTDVVGSGFVSLTSETNTDGDIDIVIALANEATTWNYSVAVECIDTNGFSTFTIG